MGTLFDDVFMGTTEKYNQKLKLLSQMGAAGKMDI